MIGQMYERLISVSERRRFGQFYTSPDVVDLINAFCIREPEDRVLDPACGGGTFLVRAYSRKRTLAQFAGRPPLSHEHLLEQIFGVDIAAFPAQLSTINLAVRHLSDEANYPRVARASFFDAQAGLPMYDIPLSGDSVRSIALEKVDAIVGNPPLHLGRRASVGSTSPTTTNCSAMSGRARGCCQGGRTYTLTSSPMPPICSIRAGTSASSPASAGWTPTTASSYRSSSFATSTSSRSSSHRWRSGSKTRVSPPPSQSSSANRTVRSGKPTRSASSSSESRSPRSTPKL